MFHDGRNQVPLCQAEMSNTRLVFQAGNTKESYLPGWQHMCRTNQYMSGLKWIYRILHLEFFRNYNKLKLSVHQVLSNATLCDNGIPYIADANLSKPHCCIASVFQIPDYLNLTTALPHGLSRITPSCYYGNRMMILICLVLDSPAQQEINSQLIYSWMVCTQTPQAHKFKWSTDQFLSHTILIQQ